MVFNWFRRQFTPQDSTQPADSPAPAETSPETPESEAEADAEASADSASGEAASVATPTVQEDYLNWAKTAYQNLQKQQELAQKLTEEAVTEAAATEAAATEAAVTEEAVTEEAVPEEAVAEAAVAEETVTEEAVTEAAVTEAAVAEAAVTEEAVTEEAVTEAAVAEAAVTEEAVTEAAVTEEAVTEEAVTEEAVAEEAVIEEAVIEEAVAEEAVAEEAVTEEAVAEEAVTVAEEAVTEEAVAESVIPETPITPESPVPQEAVSDVSVEPEDSEPETPAASAMPGPALSFLERAEAERQERLERVKAEAIAGPEPEPEPAPTPDPAPAGIAFDENFVWSAEVLAAQGRRPDEISIEEITWLRRLRQGLDKTRRNLVNQLKGLVGQGPLNQAAVDEIESLLLQADVGVEATDIVVSALQQRLREEALPPDAAIAYLKQLLREILDRPIQERGEESGLLIPTKDTLNIWLMTGVNGAGKTTTIGKLAHLAVKSDYRCLIAAADTFRAAAVEQVRIWGQRSGVDVIANPGQNTDPAAVVFDAIAAAQSRNAELLLVDTAGRLQNKKNLMDELSKVRRIVDKKAPGAIVESLLVLDATLGQNGLQQARIFAEAAQLSGVILTKLDGTARGGVALAVTQQLNLPIRFIGAGEGIEDLRPFSSYEFVEALLSS